MRTFDTGATRDSTDGKYDYEGFFSPLVMQRFAAYMHKHRKQADGQLRDSDNWQKGIPREAYIKSKLRHAITTWLILRGHPQVDERDEHTITLQESLCAEMFNIQGLLFELLKESEQEDDTNG